MNNINLWLNDAIFNNPKFSVFDTVLKIIIPIGFAIFLNWLFRRWVRVPKNLESARTKTYLSVTQSLISTFIYITAVYFIFIQLNIIVAPLFASAGVIGIVIGLGVRSFIEDFFTGLFILTGDTIRVGDYVEINGAQGITEALGFTTLRIKDQDGAVHIFPNREIKNIVNYSRRMARVIVDVPVKSNQSVDRAIEALSRAIKELKRIRCSELLFRKDHSFRESNR